jgi:hypothetical protein
MHPIQMLIARKIKEGLTRKTVSSCSVWAENYRVLQSGPWSFRTHPWLREMHDSNAEMNIGQKAAQMGFTEWALNRVLYSIDMRGLDCLYILPSSKPDATDFSSARFGPAIELSPHLKDLFSEVSNIGHKRAGAANLYIRGSHARSQLKSIPVNIIVCDEKDEMTQENIPLALERQSGQMIREVVQISTPTYTGYGINADFERSTQNHFFFNCPSCNRFIELNFPDDLVITADNLTDATLKDSYIKCNQCQNKLPHHAKSEFLAEGRWVSAYPGRDWVGWYINQFYSVELEPWKIAETSLKALSNPADETELWNSKGGLPHIVKGSGLTEAEIEECVGDYVMTPLEGPTRNNNRIVTMGADVGFPFIHYEIDEWFLPPPGTPVVDINQYSKPKVLRAGEITSFNELSELINSFRVNFTVVDAQPERRQAISFANNHYGRVRLCTYEQGITGKAIHIGSDEPTVKVDRTSWLDLSLGRFRVKSIRLPANIPFDYKQHIRAQVRIYEKDRHGNPVGRYITPVGDDHYGHARNYAEIALQLACQNVASASIKERLF